MNTIICAPDAAKRFNYNKEAILEAARQLGSEADDVEFEGMPTIELTCLPECEIPVFDRRKSKHNEPNYAGWHELPPDRILNKRGKRK